MTDELKRKNMKIETEFKLVPLHELKDTSAYQQTLELLISTFIDSELYVALFPDHAQRHALFPWFMDKRMQLLKDHSVILMKKSVYETRDFDKNFVIGHAVMIPGSDTMNPSIWTLLRFLLKVNQ